MVKPHKNILVAGASGYSGRATVERLLEHGYHVRALTRQPSAFDNLKHDRLDIRVWDCEKEPGHDLCEGIDAVISTMARYEGSQDSPQTIDFGGNLKLLESAKLHQVSMFVYLTMIDGDKIRYYSDGVGAKEAFIDALKDAPGAMNRFLVRASGFMKDIQMIAKAIQKNKQMTLIGQGDNRFNLISDKGLAIALTDPIMHPTDKVGVYQERQVGGADIVSLKELSEKIFSAAGLPPKYRHIPKWVVNAASTGIKWVRPSFYRKISMPLFLMTHDFIGEKIADPVSVSQYIHDHVQPINEKEQANVS